MQPQESSLIVRLLSKYDYPTKFIFISILFAFSILVSNFFMIRAQNEKITFAERELLGARYETSLRKLLESVVKHELLATQEYSIEPPSRVEINTVQQQVSSNLTNIKVLDAALEDDLQTTAADFQLRDKAHLRPNELEAKWNELLKETGVLKAEHNATAHERIINDIVGLMGYVGDYSNLYLDPYVESTYLAEVNFVLTPNLQAIIPRLTTQLETIANSKATTLSLEDRFTISSEVANLETYRDLIREAIEKVFSEEKNTDSAVDIESKVKDPALQYLSNISEYITYIKRNYILNDKFTDHQTEILAMASKTIDNGFVLWDTTNDVIVRILENRIQEYRHEMLMALLISFICALIGFTIGFIVMKEISRPLLRLLTAAKQLAGGDLSVKIPVTVEDEVGQVGLAFNQMVDALHELIGRLQWTGIQLTTSTTEISAAAKEQEATVVEQEATTKQIAVTAKEISATAKDFAMTMNSISNTAEQTSELASLVKSGLVKMEEAMRHMVDASSNIAGKLAVLNEKASNITTVITTITKVADQTNLLSLNAAIEAEKAGEHGRSFAVIAREIRRLADQTANATLDIEKMVNEIVSAVSAGVMGVDKFSEEIHSGVDQVSVISDQLGKIIEQVQEVTESFESVNQGMQAQSVGAEQINESITQLSGAAQQTTASIRQFHNAIDQLNNAAQEMQTAVSKIKR